MWHPTRDRFWFWIIYISPRQGFWWRRRRWLRRRPSRWRIRCDIVRSSTLIFPEVAPVITEITDVFSKENDPIPSEVTTIMELVDVFPKDVTRNGICQTHLTHLPIVSTTFSQLRVKNCKVIVDNGSCTNAIFFKVFKNDGLKSLPHPYPFKISCLRRQQ